MAHKRNGIPVSPGGGGWRVNPAAVEGGDWVTRLGQWPTPWFLVALIAAATAPYANTLHGKWVYDDKVAVSGNPDVYRQDVPWSALWGHDFWGNDMYTRRGHGWTHHSWRPAVVATFRLDWRMGGGSVVPFHITNLIVHACACMAAAWAAGQLAHLACTASTRVTHHPALGRGGSTSSPTIRTAKQPPAPWHTGVARLCALLFALHPIHSECVANVTSRADAAAGVWVLAALGAAAACIRRAYTAPTTLRAAGWHGACAMWVACGVAMGLLCKETALVLPGLVMTLHLAMACVQVTASQPPLPTTTVVLTTVAHLATQAVVAAAAYHIRVIVMAKGYALHTWANPIHNTLYHACATSFERWASIAYVQAFALSKLVAPVFLSHEHNAMAHVTTWMDGRNVLTLTVWVVVVGMALHIWRTLQRGPAAANGATSPSTDRGPWVAHACRMLFGCGLAVAAYLPSAHLLQYVAFILAERTLFLPSFGAAILLAEAIAVMARGGVDALPPLGWQEAGGVPAPRLHPSAPSLEAAGPMTAGWATTCTPIYPPPAPSSDQGGRRMRRSSGASNMVPPSPPFHASCRAAVALPSTPTTQRPSRAWQAASMAAMCLLACAYLGRIVTRNAEWADEESLMASNLALYPTNNVMTVYGLGAVALYRGEYDTAERLLRDAAANSTMVEPHILLSQLYWRRDGGTDGGYARALAELQVVAASNSPRKEVLTNMGLLMYKLRNATSQTAAAAAEDEAWMRSAEYHVLAAHVAHGYPEHHQAISLLASNAGCIRLTSATSRWGRPDSAGQAFEEAVAGAMHGGTPTAFRNAAVYHLVQGHAHRARDVIAQAMPIVQQQAAAAAAAVDGGRGQAITQAATMTYLADIHTTLVRLNATANAMAAWITPWSTLPPVAGEAADSRLRALGYDCQLELLWW